ncbi:MAG: hypothetical protein ACD_47C00318G0003, partial [uncultured bacterium]
TAEAAGSLTLSLVAIFLPVIAFVIFIVLIIYFIRKKTKVIPAAIPAEKQ